MLSHDSSLFLHENPIISLDLKLFKCLNACGYFQWVKKNVPKK